MKNSVNKGFFTYLILLVVMALGVALVAGVIMMFSPGTPVLGYVYVSDKSHVRIRNYEGEDIVNRAGSQVVVLDDQGQQKEKNEASQSIEFSQLNKLVIKTNGMGVVLINAGENELDRVDVIRGVTGFTKQQDAKKLVITKHYDPVNQVFTITAFDTNPLIKLSNSSAIKVYFKNQPTNLEVEIKTAEAGLGVGTTKFNQSTPIDVNLKSLRFETETGNLSFSAKASVSSNLSVVSKDKSQVDINADLTLETANFNLNQGRINAKNITANSMQLKGESAFVSFNQVVLGSSKTLVLHLKNGDFKAKLFDGNITDLDVNDGVVENLSIGIETLTGNITVAKTVIANANKANIVLGEVGGTANIKTSLGNVYIKKIKHQAIIETVSGSVYLKNQDTATGHLKIKTGTGNINLLLDRVTSDVGESTNLVQSDRGNINLFYLNTLKDFTITATAKGTISFPYDEFSKKDSQVIGYPSPLQNQPALPHTKNLGLTTNGNIKVEPVQSTLWSLIVPA